MLAFSKLIKEYYTFIFVLGEPNLLGEYHKIETIKPLNIYISAYQELHETPSS